MNLGVALPGPHRREALAVMEHCVESGMSWGRAYAVACFASYGERDVWTFQATVAQFTRLSVRTIQRAARQAKQIGVLISRRLRRGERPRGASQPITCGGALRRFIAWGKPKKQALALRAKYALRELWRRDDRARRVEAEQAEIARALTEFRQLGT